MQKCKETKSKCVHCELDWEVQCAARVENMWHVGQNHHQWISNCLTVYMKVFAFLYWTAKSSLTVKIPSRVLKALNPCKTLKELLTLVLKMEEIQSDMAYVTSALLMAVWDRTEKRPWCRCSSRGSAPGGARTVCSESSYAIKLRSSASPALYTTQWEPEKDVSQLSIGFILHGLL